MSNYRVSGEDLLAVANAIRTKGGTSAALPFPGGFVTAIGNISTGQQPTLITKSITENGTYNASSDNADGYSQVSVAVSPKFVTGTFEGTTAEASMDVNIPYMGNGYPIACIVYPTGGLFTSGSDFAALVQNKAHAIFAMVKADAGSAPTYNDSTLLTNKASVLGMYKNSDSDPSSMNGSINAQTHFFRNENAGTSWNTCLRFRENKKMAVYIAGTGNGFAKDIEYTYQIIYSS